MPRERELKGVLWNFLGTFTSRYTDYEGYWLFGFLIDKDAPLDIDLLGDVASEGSPLGVAVDKARARFAEQVTKAGLTRAALKEASLTLRPTGVERDLSVGDHRRGYVRHCYEMELLARVVVVSGRTYETTQLMLVARHDPDKESRSESDRRYPGVSGEADESS